MKTRVFTEPGFPLSRSPRSLTRMEKRLAPLFILIFLLASALSSLVFSKEVAVPLASTTGKICTTQDANFSGAFRYQEKIPYCTRKVTQAEKREIAKIYGVPQSRWSLYEFDHLIPLSSGGSNAAENIWMEPLDQAHLKDLIEIQVYRRLADGTMTQQEAVEKLENWFCDPCHDLDGKNICTIEPIHGLDDNACSAFKSKMVGAKGKRRGLHVIAKKP